MKFADEYRDPQVAKALLAAIRKDIDAVRDELQRIGALESQVAGAATTENTDALSERIDGLEESLSSIAAGEEALAAVESFNADKIEGTDDWRLPTIRELDSLTDLRRHSPAVATDPMGMEEADILVRLAPRDQWTTAETNEGLVEAISISRTIAAQTGQRVERFVALAAIHCSKTAMVLKSHPPERLRCAGPSRCGRGRARRITRLPHVHRGLACPCQQQTGLR